MNDYSLNESAYRAKLAVRGIGYSWGIAQDAARALHWLSARGIDGFTPLSVTLSSIDSGQLGAPIDLHSDWESERSALCPLLTGTCVNDNGTHLISTHCIHLKELAAPLLVLPFIADVASAFNCTLHFSCTEFDAIVSHNDLLIRGDINVSHIGAASLTCSKSKTATANPEYTTISQRVSRVSVESAVWHQLGEYAHRTYAPATAESRLSGAGAGLTDSD